MRALDPRRPQLTSTLYIFPRSFLCLLLLQLLLHDARARSVPRDEEDAVPSAVKLSPIENSGDTDRVISGNDAAANVRGKLAQPQGHDAENEGTVPEESENTEKKISQWAVGGRSHDREDAPASDRESGVAKEEPKKIDTAEAGVALKQEGDEASVVKKRRRNDVALVGKSESPEGETEGIRRFDARIDAEGVASGIEVPLEKQKYKESLESVEESRPIEETNESKEKIPNYFRKSGKIEDDRGKSEEIESNESSESVESDEYQANRDYRSLAEVRDKAKRKSSTVYLNAEEKKIPDGEQQSIVDGQIKKLISIRDDALDARKTEKIDEAQVLSSAKEVGVDEVAFAQEGIRDRLKIKVKNTDPTDTERSLGGAGLLSVWKDQAVSLQEQIRDRTFLSRLKEQTSEVLPEIPKFTESQLLATLERIVLSKRLKPSNDSYAVDMKGLGLSENQLRIVQCAEQLLPVKDRRSFVDDLSECIRGLSILNCMRIFVWPIVVENLPKPIGQTLADLPIEINVFDLFQGNGQKSGRARDLREIRLLTPDSVVYNILQDALESYPSDETLISYIDPRNETMKKLLSADRMNILQMAEKFLPQTLRQDYSDKMFSCVRRFEYYSCVKYFAWPLIKRYFPALPAFPEYHSWYPIVDLSPQYPIFPFPGFSEDVGELPEVVDADATGTRKPGPEATIVQVLRNTPKEQPRISTSPSFLDRSTDTYVALIPEDQLSTIDTAEQSIPTSYRPQFIDKTVKCTKEYNYLTCFKYSTWPVVGQFVPTLPDISSLLPDFLAPGLSDINGYVSEIPTYSGYYWPIYGTETQKETVPPEYTLENRANAMRPTDEWEEAILKILQGVRGLADSSMQVAPSVPTTNVVDLATLAKRQIEILQLAESLVPDSARPNFDAEILAYLERSNSFIDCVRYVIWPTIAKYVPLLPEFPRQGVAKDSSDLGNVQSSMRTKGSAIGTGDIVQERIGSEIEKEKPAGVLVRDKESRNGLSDVPVVSVSGIRFVPIFTDYPEAVILNILRSLQPHTYKTSAGASSFATKNQQFIDSLNEQQINIVNIVDTLLPENVRPDFANKLIQCLRANNFLVCTKDVVWPVLSQYFPWLPSLPNFGIVTGNPSGTSTSASSDQSITEPSPSSDRPPLSETNVKTGQHGDTTVTITDTRFFPILNELPETIVLNILKAVELSVPNLPGSTVPARTHEFSAYLTEQEIDVLRIAENLLPVPTRSEFIDKIGPCIKERNFLECTRDVTWPTIAQSYPWLPSFPNFGSLQNSPQVPDSAAIGLQIFLSQNPSSETSRTGLSKKAEAPVSRETEKKIENVLLTVLSETPILDRSYLNVNDPVVSLLTKQQISILRLVERGIPDTARPSYVERMLRCVTRYNFIACTNSVAWPVLKEYVPLLPDFSTIADLSSRLPGILQIPDLGQIPVVPDLGSVANDIPGLSQLPGISNLPIEPPRLPLEHGGLAGHKYPDSPIGSHSDVPDNKTAEAPSSTPSVGNEAVVPGYAGQPPGLLVNLQGEKVDLLDNVRPQAQTADAKPGSAIKARKRRSSTDNLDSYYVTERASDDSASSPEAFPNITESEYLRLLIRVKEASRISTTGTLKPKQYLVDSLNSTMRNSLTADQYEILKIVDDLDDQPSSKGLASQVIQCITSLSFIRCLGIFIWPLIANNLPSIIGLPSLPSLPSFGILGRSIDTENRVQEFFGMSTDDFEKELLERKESIEGFLLDWYRKLVEDEFRMDVGFAKIKGYGNNELGISFSGFREGRGAKLKDNKNLPSILTIISDIMEEVLDQRPEGEKAKRDKEKKERSIDDSRETDIQFLKDSEEYVDFKRSMNDDEIIAMFLDKMRTNDSDLGNDDVEYFGSEDAYNAFGVLFGTTLHDKLAEEAETLDHRPNPLEGSIDPSKEVDIVSLESQQSSDEPKVLPPKSQETYGFEGDSAGDREERRREKRHFRIPFEIPRKFFESLLAKHSAKESFETAEDNKIVEDGHEEGARSSVVVRLPRLHDEVLPKKVTNSIIGLGRAFRSKMTQMMPGFGLILSFLLQMGLAHARAAASMAGMISNIALGTAMFGMMRDSMFGSNNHPHIKYVYDNDKTGPGIAWPTRYRSGSHYYE